jgi:insertion element IS1 protein InsB
MTCKFCDHSCQKAGKQKNGVQKFFCAVCKKYQQSVYRNKAWDRGTKPLIAKMVCESVSVRGIARILKIAINTVQADIKRTANVIVKPPIRIQQGNIEVDELRTFIGNKQNQYWVAYALNRATGEVMDFVVGKRSKRTLRTLIRTLLLSGVCKINTDRLNIYRSLITASIHDYRMYGTNRIERKNLSIRTDIKRLSRRTICFGRSRAMLENCLKIYFWGAAAVDLTKNLL